MNLNNNRNVKLTINKTRTMKNNYKEINTDTYRT